MRVIKRSGETEEVSFDKVLNRLRLLALPYKNESALNVDVFDIAQKVCTRIYDMVNTSELDELAAQICSSMIVDNPDYGILAARIIVSNHHKNTSPSFSESMSMLFNNKDNHGDNNSLITEELYDTVMKYKEKLNSIIDYSRDYTFDYFGFKTLERSYLMKVDGKVVERPQHMLMRVSLGIHGCDVKDAIQTYELMSTKYFTHATPTLFNAGTPRPQLSSCFLLSINADSIDGIFSSVHECASISKYAGGIGIHVHDVRGKGSRIRGTNGTSDGIVPMLKVFNNVARYVNQSGRRNGSIAVYLEPWHADIMDFLELKKPHGSEEDRARDLFYALWIPDMFMERVKVGGKWSLMCPDTCHGLADCYGDDFKKLYERYEREGRFVKQVDAQTLWFKICECQIESGVPYLLYKDAANAKSNQKNLGTIKSSNLCVAPETMILTDEGYFPIVDLKDKAVNVWNGKEFSSTVVKQTGRQQKLITVKFDNNQKLECTPYHKFYLSDDHNGEIVVQASDLKKGDALCKYVLPDSDHIYNIKVSGIEDNNRFDDTFCFNEPKEHKGIFNGILTGQCTEIIEYSSPDETAVCNLSSIGLPTFVEYRQDKTPYFNFEKLHEITMVVTKNLNKVIDVNYYPVEKARRSNLRHRPIGIGVQGLADTYVLMGYPFDSPEAAQLNKDIFETIYHASVEQSMLISKKRHEMIEEFNVTKDEKIIDYLKLNEFDPIFDNNYPGAYSSFAGSPAQQGILQFDMWNVVPSDRYDWNSLKENIKKYGMRNSLLLAPMPTASTSQIMGFNEACEAFTSNIYKRKTLAGEFILVNKYLLKDLIKLGLWNKDMKNKIIINEGSIQDISEIPQNIKDLYKTVWEIKQKHIIDQARDRGAYICQSQSMNLFLEEPNFKQLSSMHFYAWQAGLKTGIYYLRSKPKAKQIKFTVDPLLQKQMQEEKEKKKNVVCTDEVCTVCSS
jgi:ribonucleotide reductase alpha subunit